jgi:D-alanine-D-alanine ligase
MNPKLRIAVLSGGPSAEHTVSLKTGAMIFKHLDRDKYHPTLITVSRRGKWPITFKKLKKDFDLAFIAMHGEYGEDGTIQRILEKHRIPFTGSGARASKLGMDKIASMRLFQKNGLRVPRWQLVRKKILHMSLPLVVKPADRGSSVGITMVKSKKRIPAAIAKARRVSKRVIAQQYIKGKELTCGMVEVKGKPRALPPTEIIPKQKTFFDYQEKYSTNGAAEITPARLPQSMRKKIQRAALITHRIIGASGYSRSDFILDTTNKLWILEINTLPGLTEASLLPKAARVADILFSKLLDHIIDAGLKK